MQWSPRNHGSRREGVTSAPRAQVAAPRRTILRRRALAALATLAALGPAAWASLPGSSAHSGSRAGGAVQVSSAASQVAPTRFAVRRLRAALPFALQDEACAYLGSGRVALLGGLNASDTSTAAVSVLDGQGVHPGGLLPEPQHDAQAAALDGGVFVFGGGQFSSYDHILAYDSAGGRVSEAARLPTPASDAAVAVIAGTAYVVGGYDGQQALDTIVAWRPGEQPRLAGRLPDGLRYAAVAAGSGRLLIAGGSREETATRSILSFDPGTGVVRQVGELPFPVTHAAAVMLGSYLYLLGGRGSEPGSQRATITAIDTTSGRALRDGTLPLRLSDTCAVTLGERVWLIGGLSPTGTLASVFELTPAGP
jgi:Kelch motif